jgi:hypothetical protein
VSQAWLVSRRFVHVCLDLQSAPCTLLLGQTWFIALLLVKASLLPGCLACGL